MTLKEIMQNVKANHFIKNFTSINITGGIYARLRGENTQGKNGGEPNESEQVEIAKGFYKLSDIMRKWADETFEKFGIKK